MKFMRDEIFRLILTVLIPLAIVGIVCGCPLLYFNYKIEAAMYIWFAIGLPFSTISIIFAVLWFIQLYTEQLKEIKK